MEFLIHECSYLPENVVSIFCSDEVKEDAQPIWQMLISHKANEDDLENNHLLENVGDLIWQTSVQIQCCPYCGEKLERELTLQKQLYYYHFNAC
ncbi:hypothetical protein BOO24_18350 [Vibrio navarrensis]|uniref:hypothetical protein n=1 Tax=Vibrio navarrensis TaxID=29495 RepID=UPI00186A7D58|nr:hypothetical protein [Vibrio navarrensis]MBE4594301.1 hypothetical protein [Vibrio navarrensis]